MNASEPINFPMINPLTRIIRNITALSFVFATTILAQAPVPRAMREVTEDDRIWAITVDDKALSFYSEESSHFYKHHDVNSDGGAKLTIRTAKELDEWNSLFKKFLEWEKIARENKVQTFTKAIGTVDSKEIVFYYYPPDAWMGSYIRAREILHWNKLLEQLPAMRHEVDGMKKNAAKTETLFK